MVVQIVVIGAGFTGAAAAQTLGKKLKADQVHITVLEKQSHQSMHLGATRACVDPAFVPKMFIPYDKVWGKASGHTTRLEGIATKLEAKQVTVSLCKDGELTGEEKVLPFDFAILAMGQTYPGPIKPDMTTPQSRASIENAFAKSAAAVEAAKTCLIVGGGTVGCELAGEIKAKHPGKKVILLDSNETLIARQKLKPAFKKKVLDTLVQKLGVEVMLSERLEERTKVTTLTKQTVKMTSGKEITADVTFLCGGGKPNSSLVLTLSQELLDDHGFVKVKATLQIDGGDGAYDHIFAIGDVNNHATPKLAYWGAMQGQKVAEELAHHIKTSKPLQHKVFDFGGAEACIVPMGPKYGAAQLPVFGGLMVGSFMVSKMKGSDMMAGQMWAGMGVKPPK